MRAGFSETILASFGTPRRTGGSRRQLLLLVSFLTIFAATARAQTSIKRNDRPPDTANVQKTAAEEKKLADGSRYRWTFAQPDFIVNHIVIEHDATGHGTVQFEKKGEDGSITEPINLSPSTLAKLFKLWQALHFLDSTENYQASKNFAHLGVYTLSMDDSKRKRTAEFNWSTNADAWNLVQEYRRVADQAIFIFDITVARENQPLNTPGLLNQLDSMYTRNGLSDPKQLLPLLKDLRTDERIPLIARNHADRLLKKIEK